MLIDPCSQKETVPDQCVACIHRRAPSIPDPFSGVALRSSNVFDLRKKWTSELRRRALTEGQAKSAGGTFSEDPWYWSHCAHYSRPGAYVFCCIQNPSDDCSAAEAS